jgi:small subunit ribosomal protein S7
MRGKQAPKRKKDGDLRYNDQNIAKLICYIMKDGKKAAAERIVYDSFEFVKQDTKQDPRHVFNKAMKKVAPLIEVRSKRVGGSNFQVPCQVRGNRRFILGCRWMIGAAKARKGMPMAKRLALEILDAAKGEGAAVRKREDVHRMAEANKAFAHFAR